MSSLLTCPATYQFTDDIPYWQENYFWYDFQKSITFWRWGGRDVSIFGSGTLNGNGQRWYNGFAGQSILVCYWLQSFLMGISLTAN